VSRMVRRGGRFVDADAPEPPADPARVARDRAADIADVCAAAGVPGMAADLIRRRVTVGEARELAGGADRIRVQCRAALGLNPQIFPQGLETATDEFIAQFVAGRLTTKALGDLLIDRAADLQSPEIRGAIQADLGHTEPGAARPDSRRIYAARRRTMGQPPA